MQHMRNRYAAEAELASRSFWRLLIFRRCIVVRLREKMRYRREVGAQQWNIGRPTRVRARPLTYLMCRECIRARVAQRAQPRARLAPRALVYVYAHAYTGACAALCTQPSHWPAYKTYIHTHTQTHTYTHTHAYIHTHTRCIAATERASERANARARVLSSSDDDDVDDDDGGGVEDGAAMGATAGAVAAALHNAARRHRLWGLCAPRGYYRLWRGRESRENALGNFQQLAAELIEIQFYASTTTSRFLADISVHARCRIYPLRIHIGIKRHSVAHFSTQFNSIMSREASVIIETITKCYYEKQRVICMKFYIEIVWNCR